MKNQEPVYHVITNVKLVKILLIAVLNALITQEAQPLQAVLVSLATIMLEKKKNVKNVLSNVKLVKLVLITVLNVLLTDLRIHNQNVAALMASTLTHKEPVFLAVINVLLATD